MIIGYTLPDAEKKIKAGSKIHTLREDINCRWRKGNIIQHSVNVRTPEQRCFLQNNCKSVQMTAIFIVEERVKTKFKQLFAPDLVLYVNIDRKLLTNKEAELFAYNDGFDSLQQMIDWFFPANKKGKRKRTMWAGKLIHWTDKKY